MCIRDRARTLGGKNIRRRSGMMVNDTTLIDFPPDIYALSLELGLDLGSVTDLMITHSHGDHFDVSELNMRQNGMFCHLGQDAPPLRLYGDDGVAPVSYTHLDVYKRQDQCDRHTRAQQQNCRNKGLFIP